MRFGARIVNFTIAIGLLLFTASSLWSQCTATEQIADFSPDNGSSNTASVTANIRAVGDLVAMTGWCYGTTGGCTNVSMKLGSQTATQTTLSGVPNGDGTPYNGSGQAWIYYVLSASQAGPQTATFTVSGSHTDIQMSYIDFSTNPGCSFTHDIDSPLGSCLASCGGPQSGTVTQPSITPTAGDLLFVFSWTSEHVTGYNSPWTCPLNASNGFCNFDTTINADAYVLSAPPGPTSNSFGLVHMSDTWQALIASFKISGGGAPGPPSNLQAIPQ